MDTPHFALGAQPLSPPIRSTKTWADTVNSRFLPLEHTALRSDGFVAQIDVLEQVPSGLAMVRSQAHRVARTRSLAERSEQGYFKTFWLLRGRCAIEQGSQRSTLEPGSWTVYDTTRPYQIEIGDDSQFLVLLLPHAACQEWQPYSEQLCGYPLAADACSRGALFALMSLFGQPADTPSPEARAVVDAAGRLLSASILQQGCVRERGGRLERRLEEARRYVVAHLSDARLTPDRLAAALNISRRALYLLFKSIGLTPGGFILEARLECCRSALADPIRRHRTITDIALESGFCDSAHFSRLFKARFGLTPRQWRERN